MLNDRRFFRLLSALAAVVLLGARSWAVPPLPDDFINDEVVFVAVFDLAQVNPGAVDATGRGVIEHVPQIGEHLGRLRADHEAFVNAGGRFLVVTGADQISDDLYAFLPVAGVFVDAQRCEEAALTAIIIRQTGEITRDPIVERHGDWLMVYKDARRRLTHRDEKDPLPEIPEVDPERTERFRTAIAALEGRSAGVLMIPTPEMRREAEGELADLKEMGAIEGFEDSPMYLPYLLAGALGVHGWADLGHNPSITAVIELADAALAAKLAGIIQSLPAFFDAQMGAFREEGEEPEPEETLMAKILGSISCVQAGSKVTVSIGPAKLRPILDAAGPILRRQQEQAREMQAASRSRQIGMALIMYAQEHDNQWPDSLDTLVTSGQMTREQLDSLLTDPATGEKSAFRYVKPDKPWNRMDNPADVAVLYELKNGQINPEGFILYADGHVARGGR